jgi:hypothetical protein
VGAGLTRKYKLARDKYSSLFYLFVSDEEEKKMFYDIDTTTVTMKNRKFPEKLADRKLADRMFPDWRCSGLILFLYFVI